MTIRLLSMITCLMMLSTTGFAEDQKPLREVQAQPVAANAQAVQVKSAAQTRLDALKKLSAAQAVAAKAIKALADAQRALLDAKDDATKKQAAENVAKAKRQLKDAQATIDARMDDAKKVGGTPAALQSVREDKLPDDPIERFVLLAPGGPLVVEASITVDGKPFRHLREELVDKMLKYASTDKDGKITWEEGFKSAGFMFNRIQISNDQQKQRYLKSYDTNANGLVDRNEARSFLSNIFRLPAFSVSTINGMAAYAGQQVFVQNGRTYSASAGSVDLFPILDTDKDGALSADEIKAAGERLKSRDADDNDLLYSQELATNAARNNPQRVAANSRPSQPFASLAFPLVAGGATGPLYQAMLQCYGDSDSQVTAEGFSSVPEVFAVIDENRDGKLQEPELGKLQDFPPHLKMTVDLGEAGKGLKLDHAAKHLQNRQAQDRVFSLDGPALKIKAIASPFAAPPRYGQSLGQTYLTRFDKDNNGYLDKAELTGNLARLMEQWDINQDGKVFPKEIVETYELMRAPQMTQVRASVSSEGNSMFQTLDQSGDNRLSLREMRTAAERLKSFDKNQDGRIETKEVPVTIAINFALGYGYVYTRPGQAGTLNAAANPPKSNTPEWFTRMDRNGDGDVTLKEFLGEKAQFDKLDANNDQFIEPKEAVAASE